MEQTIEARRAEVSRLKQVCRASLATFNADKRKPIRFTTADGKTTMRTLPSAAFVFPFGVGDKGASLHSDLARVTAERDRLANKVAQLERQLAQAVSAQAGPKSFTAEAVRAYLREHPGASYDDAYMALKPFKTTSTFAGNVG